MRAFLASWDSWARLNNCTVLLLGHPPKSSDPFSGSTDWLNACRAGITLSRAKVGVSGQGGEAEASKVLCGLSDRSRHPHPIPRLPNLP